MATTDISILSARERLARMPRALREEWIAQQPDWVLDEMARSMWWFEARPKQVPPAGGWLVCLALAGRGFGKSRAGSEWIVQRVLDFPFDRHGNPTEHLVIAATLSDARTICMEGPSGILRALDRHGKVPGKDYTYKMSPRPMILFANGSKIYCESGDDEDVGRGYTATSVWGDEICKWPKAYASWYEGIMPSLRADLSTDHPRAFITTTPKPDKLIIEWYGRKDGTVHLIRGSTFENSSNLNKHILQELKNRYEGTSIGDQELYGELLEGLDGALFKMSDINFTRVDSPPDGLTTIVVGVDPTMTDEGDEMGVVVMGRTKDDHIWVLADETITAAGREAARHVWNVAVSWGADLIVYEDNMGKRWMKDVFTDAWEEMVRAGELPFGTTPPMKPVDSKLGKRTRGEPVAMRMQQKRMHHVGIFKDLEEQLCQFTGWDGKESPDRLDAYVHAGRWLLSTEKKKVRVISPRSYVPRDAWDLTQVGA